MISLHVEPIPYSGLVVVQTLTNLLPALSKSTVSPTLFRFFLLLFSEIQCSPVDMSVYPHYLHYMFGFLSHPLGCFFFLPDFVSWRSYQRYVFDQSSKKCGPWWKVWQRVAKPCCLAGAWRFLEKLQGPVATFFGDSTVTKPCLTWIMKV